MQYYYKNATKKEHRDYNIVREAILHVFMKNVLLMPSTNMNFAPSFSPSLLG
jgi:hypothetical protein